MLWRPPQKCQFIQQFLSFFFLSIRRTLYDFFQKRLCGGFVSIQAPNKVLNGMKTSCFIGYGSQLASRKIITAVFATFLETEHLAVSFASNLHQVMFWRKYIKESWLYFDIVV
ncbi:MAG: hypothetical protein HGA42_14655 [Nostocales cyanobacterium W4_Combined_metabat2_030]|nr:hypothetical protein [Nostocales cyanobacterium W4_Combined_metabat2_030]